LFFELNDSDQDLGVQLNLGSSEYWRELSIYAPNGREIFEIETSSSLKLQGIADPLPLPRRCLRVRGKVNRWRQALWYGHPLTHTIPPGPTVVSPVDGAMNVVRNNAVVEWSVTPTADYEIDSFQLIVT
jgi:hypothetical protein